MIFFTRSCSSVFGLLRRSFFSPMRVAVGIALLIHGLLFLTLDLSRYFPNPVPNRPPVLVVERIGRPEESVTLEEIVEQGGGAEDSTPEESLPVEPEREGFATRLNLSSRLERREDRQVTLSLDTKKRKFANYFGIIQRSVRERWIYPTQARRQRMAGKLLLSFTVDSRGEVVKIHIQRSSGKEALDRAAIDAVRKAAPFPPLPEDWQLQRLNIVTDFEYVLKGSGE